jgi:hypothetical protein
MKNQYLVSTNNLTQKDLIFMHLLYLYGQNEHTNLYHVIYIAFQHVATTVKVKIFKINKRMFCTKATKYL